MPNHVVTTGTHFSFTYVEANKMLDDAQSAVIDSLRYMASVRNCKGNVLTYLRKDLLN